MKLVATAVSMALTALAASLPRMSDNSARVALDEGPPGLIGETGGVLKLRSPGSPMVLIPAGTFTMGSSEEDVVAALADCTRQPLGHRCEEAMFSDELPLRRVALSAFWLDRTEVTIAEYRRCATLRRCRPFPTYSGASRFDRPRYPVSLVTWEDAQRFCAFRNARLPTEAEFERAARGLSRRTYPWGNLYNSHVSNHGRFSWDPTDDGDGFAELAPVGSFPQGATPDGLLDLAGNVSEWVSDRYAPKYDEKDVRDPQGPPAAMGTGRVIRGGSYDSGAPQVRGAARYGADPTARAPSIGFRCAKGT